MYKERLRNMGLFILEQDLGGLDFIVCKYLMGVWKKVTPDHSLVVSSEWRRSNKHKLKYRKFPSSRSKPVPW